jgi:acetylglutamate kinase
MTQQLQALQKANATRLARAQIKRDLHNMTPADSVATLASLIVDGDEHALNLRVGEALLSCPKLGPSVLRMVCRTAGLVTADHRIRELTPRQRAELVRVLRVPGVLPARFVR